MSDFFIQLPIEGVPAYANVGAFPPSASLGSLAVSQATGILYEWNGSAWVQLASPASSPGAIDGLTSDISASGPGVVAATVNSVGGSTAAAIHQSVLDTVAATSANTASTIMKRDASGDVNASAYIMPGLTGVVGTGSIADIFGNGINLVLATTVNPDSGAFLRFIRSGGSLAVPAAVASGMVIGGVSVAGTYDSSHVNTVAPGATGAPWKLIATENYTSATTSGFKQVFGTYGNASAGGHDVLTLNEDASAVFASTLSASNLSGTNTGDVSFSDSLVQTGSNVTLVNDSASPTASQYYGTDSGSVLGYHNLPSSGGSPGGTDTAIQINESSAFGGNVSYLATSSDYKRLLLNAPTDDTTSTLQLVGTEVISGSPSISVAVTANIADPTYDETVTGDGTSTISTLFGVNYTVSVGGSIILLKGVSITVGSGQAPAAAYNNDTANLIRYNAVTAGAAGNSIEITYIEDGVAGSETVNVVGSQITVHIGDSGVLASTNDQIITAIQASIPASALVTVTNLNPGQNESSDDFFLFHGLDGVYSSFSGSIVYPSLSTYSAININGVQSLNPDGSIGIGASINATVQSLIIGTNAIAFGNFATCLGYATEAGINSIAIGSSVIVSGQNSIGIGASSSGDGAIGIGFNANAGTNTVAIGTAVNANYNSSCAVGHGANANGIGTTSVGSSSYSANSYSVAIGYNSSADGIHSIVVGASSTANDYTIALGTGINVVNISSTVIGSDQSLSANLNDSKAPGGVTLGGYNGNTVSGENWLMINPPVLTENASGNDNWTIEWVAVTAGPSGNSITVTYVDDGTFPEVVGVIGSAITVQLDGTGNTSQSTEASVQAAVAAYPAAAALVTGYNGDTTVPTNWVTTLAGGGGTGPNSPRVIIGASVTDDLSSALQLYGALKLCDYSTIVTPVEGQLAYNFSTHNPVFYNGSTWTAV